MKEKLSAWQQFTNMLTPGTREALTGVPCSVVDDEKDAYISFKKTLSDNTESAIRAMADDMTSAEDVSVNRFRYCLIECPDGDWSTVKLFKTVEALVKRLADLSGTDTVVWPFFGVPLRFTKGPDRYLFMPDGLHAMYISAQKGNRHVIDIDDALIADADLQEDGFLGLPELANHPANLKPEKPK